MMKRIQFKSNSAQRVYDDYITRCKKSMKPLSDKDKEESLLEINSHIYEHLQDHATDDEMESLLDVIERLGAPEETLKEYVAAKKIDQAVKTFNPKYLIQALYLNIRNGIGYVFLSVLVLFFCCFLFLIVFKAVSPDNVGLFIGEGTFMFGHTTVVTSGREVLGNWFIPVMLVASGLLYLIILFILKLLKNK